VRSLKTISGAPATFWQLAPAMTVFIGLFVAPQLYFLVLSFR
jgi:hypothetical protein